MPLSLCYRTPRQGSRYGYFLPSNYTHKRWNYFYKPMVNSEINDGPLADTLPAQEGKRLSRL